MTIKELKVQYAKSKRNTKLSPSFEVDHNKGTLAVTEYLIGGTTCMHHYKKQGKDGWVHDRTEA